MFKILSVMLSFLRELIFDSKEEYDFGSTKFNTRKFTIFIVIGLSIFFNMLLTIKIYHLAQANVTMKKNCVEKVKEVKKQ